MRARWAWGLAAALAVVFALPVAAAATAPVTLDAGYVLDEADVLSGSEEQQADQRLRALRERTGLDLWVVFVDRFTSPSDSEQWATATAQQNGLGPTQYLLAVAVDSRQFYLSADEQGPLSFEQVTRIEQARIRPALGAEDWPGAVDAAAMGIEEVGSGGASGQPPGTGGTPVVALALVLLGVFAVAWVWLAIRRRRAAAAAGADASEAAPAPSLDELSRQAGSALVRTDDAVKTSEQEVGFARAQFGDDVTADFRDVIERAKADLDRAFRLQQSLDDEVPETDQQKREAYAEILRLCQQVNEELDDKADAFEALRELERTAPEALARVRVARDAAAAGIDAAEAALGRLRQDYDDEVLATVIDNPDQARARIAFADQQLAEASADLEAGRSGEAALGIRAAEEAVGQARLLQDATARLGDDLANADARARALVTDIESDLVRAQSLPDAAGRLAPAVAAARAAVSQAQEHLRAAPRRPLRALAALESANASLDGALAEVTQAAEQQERARAQLEHTLLRARAQVSATEDFIVARRGAVGAAARTRLSEAQAAIAEAEGTRGSDPVRAVAAAHRANEQAAQALQHAQQDVSSFHGGYGSAPVGDGNMGAFLGGILLSSLMNSGGPTRGFGGGSSFGSGLGFGSGGGRGIRTGGFGGGGSRSRRGGGRF